MYKDERVYSAMFQYTYDDGSVLYGSDSGDYDYLLWLMRAELKNCKHLVKMKIVELCFEDAFGNVRRLTVEEVGA